MERHVCSRKEIVERDLANLDVADDLTSLVLDELNAHLRMKRVSKCERGGQFAEKGGGKLLLKVAGGGNVITIKWRRRRR